MKTIKTLMLITGFIAYDTTSFCMEATMQELHRTAAHGTVAELKERLANKKYDINDIFEGKTLLMQAALGGNHATTAFLLNQRTIDVDKTNEGGLTALTMACVSGDSKCVNHLLNAGARVSSAKALFYVSFHGHSHLFDTILTARAHQNKRDIDVALVNASAYDDEKNQEMVSKLLSAGADPNSGLPIACSNKNPKVLSILFEAGADTIELNSK